MAATGAGFLLDMAAFMPLKKLGFFPSAGVCGESVEVEEQVMHEPPMVQDARSCVQRDPESRAAAVRESIKPDVPQRGHPSVSCGPAAPWCAATPALHACMLDICTKEVDTRGQHWRLQQLSTVLIIPLTHTPGHDDS